jgi:cytochrome b6-f complex iron-sulfur subunit
MKPSKRQEIVTPSRVEEPPVAVSEPGRREFLTWAAGWLFSVGALLSCGIGAVRFLIPNVHYGPSPRILLDLPSHYPVGITYLEKHRVYLVRTGDDFRALSGVCTHLGCTVSLAGSGREYRCPCHGSRFDSKGQVLKGPAPRPLPWLAVEQTVDGRLIVDRSREVTEAVKLRV